MRKPTRERREIMTHETTTITLNKLVAWDGNVRKTGVAEGIDELAASIAAHGLFAIACRA
jgi:hypothetical protein